MKFIKTIIIIFLLSSCNSETKQNKENEIANDTAVQEALKNLKENNSNTEKINEAISLADNAMKNENSSRQEALYTLAIEKFGEANYICEKYAICYFGRAGIYLGTKNFENACSDYNQFMTIYENNQNIHSPNMEDIYVQAKNTIAKFCSKSAE